MQGTMPNPYKGTLDGIRAVTAKEGWAGLYKGIYPLWGRQIPYTMMKFASFETIVEMIYDRLPGQKSDYSKPAQTGVSFAGGYLAGILCAIVSHPADVMVSKLNAYREPGEAFGGAVGRIYKDIGFRGLWNGLPVRIVMIGTLTGLQWMIYVRLLSPLIKVNTHKTDPFPGLLQDLHGFPDDRWRASSCREEVKALLRDAEMYRGGDDKLYCGFRELVTDQKGIAKLLGRAIQCIFFSCSYRVSYIHLHTRSHEWRRNCRILLLKSPFLSHLFLPIPSDDVPSRVSAAANRSPMHLAPPPPLTKGSSAGYRRSMRQFTPSRGSRSLPDGKREQFTEPSNRASKFSHPPFSQQPSPPKCDVQCVTSCW